MNFLTRAFARLPSPLGLCPRVLSLKGRAGETKVIPAEAQMQSAGRRLVMDTGFRRYDTDRYKQESRRREGADNSILCALGLARHGRLLLHDFVREARRAVGHA